MDESTKSSPCKECNEGADGLQLHAELDHLRQHLSERDSHIIVIEGEYLKCTARANDLEEQLNTWREKYERLYDSHKRVQKLNQVLEDKLLQMVDKMKSEKSQLTKDIATLSVRLAESKHNYSMLQKENERYKNDMNLAIQLLQCKPDNFVSQKLDNLSVDTQARVSQYVMSKTSKPSSATHSKNGNDIDPFDASEYEFNISASLMTKILEDSIQDTVTKHCDTCSCNKTHNKPFCYNESYYSVSTQTVLSGDQKNSLCLNCNAEIKSAHSNLSVRSNSPHVIKLINDTTSTRSLISPMYIIPQKIDNDKKVHAPITENIKNISISADNMKNEDDNNILESNVMKDALSKVEITNSHRHNNDMDMEPAVHHKLCDRTKTSISSNKSSINGAGLDDLLMNQNKIKIKETKSITDKKLADNTSLRKNSHSSMDAMSRTSSIAKSTVSTHKSNAQVGPGPRFCHLRMQAGSKNILLDNAEPDVPPVLYTRQSKCNEHSLFKDLTDDLDNFINLEKREVNVKEELKNDNVVVESTLIDVHIDNNNKDSNTVDEGSAINPILLNVSSSPLQPLKTHNYSNSSEHNNNNKSQSSQQNISDIDNLLNDFNANLNRNNNSNIDDVSKKQNVLPPTDNHDVKIFNFDRYEQSRFSSGQYNKPMEKIDMSQLHSIEKTKISKDLPPLGEASKLENKTDGAKATTMPPVVNVYPNLTQTHLKVNEHNKVFTNDHSVSSLSSDDSAALLQKQQLLRVAEWVEKNLEQQNNFNEPLDDDGNFNSRANKRDSKLSRLTETLNELALNMPHPVSKYSKSYNKERHSTWLLNNNIPTHEKILKHNNSKANKISCNVVKETIFPVESGGATTEIRKENTMNKGNARDYDVNKELLSTLKIKSEKELTREDLARMEYNVKKFLLSGPHWVNPAPVGRSRRTSSKTETDV